jgi:hypothetical protein
VRDRDAFATLTPQMILGAMRLHPRVAYQGHFGDAAARSRLAATLPSLTPFRARYHGAISVVDWDHQLPSRSLALRIFAYYDAAALSAGEEAFDDRLEQIGARDRFPEFDVPDFADLPADEAYECELGPDGSVARTRLTSAWRREVGERESLWAVDIARASKEFAQVIAAAVDRPRHLGDLEAVSWTPPCESGHPKWTVDVWYLLAFDGRMGTGRSILVELGDKASDRRVVAIRDFSVRAG